jgi:ribosomal protein S18 acetylase RimI-like enzyme
VQIRTFVLDDYEAVTELWRNAGDGIQLRRSDTRQAIAHKVQRDPDLFLVAEEDGQLIGAVMGGYDGRRGLVYHLATRADRRRRGVATALMSELETRLRRLGCVKVYLLVTQDAADAQAYYLSRGWEDMSPAVRIFGKELA